MDKIMLLLGGFSGGSQFLISVANPFVETPMDKNYAPSGRLQWTVAISQFSSKSFRADPPCTKL